MPYLIVFRHPGAQTCEIVHGRYSFDEACELANRVIDNRCEAYVFDEPPTGLTVWVDGDEVRGAATEDPRPELRVEPRFKGTPGAKPPFKLQPLPEKRVP